MDAVRRRERIAWPGGLRDSLPKMAAVVDWEVLSPGAEPEYFPERMRTVEVIEPRKERGPKKCAVSCSRFPADDDYRNGLPEIGN